MALGLLIRGALLLGGAVATGAALGPTIWRNGRPLAKSALKTGLEAAEAARVAAARFVEDVEDLVAEVKQEQEEAREEAPPEAPETGEMPPNDNVAAKKASND